MRNLITTQKTPSNDNVKITNELKTVADSRLVRFALSGYSDSHSDPATNRDVMAIKAVSKE